MDSATVKAKLADAWQRQQSGNLDEAEAVYRYVLEQDPDSAEAWCYLGMLLREREDYAESVSAYRRAIQLKPHYPNAWNNLGNALRMLDKPVDARAAFVEAIRQKPDYLNAIRNLGTLSVFDGELQHAIEMFRDGLRLDPDNAELHRNLGVLLLLRGEFEEGWREYGWRWKAARLRRPPVTQPMWDGSDLNGKTIFLYPEQGLGDTIHFVRFAKVLKDQGARTIVQVPPRLIPLMTTCDGIDQLLPTGVAPRSIDFHCSLVEVAERLTVNTAAIPATIASTGNYLHAAVNLIDQWKQWFPPCEGKKKIGICWQGNPDHQADVFRSIPLTTFAPLVEQGEFQFTSMQFGFGSEQLDVVPFADRILRLPETVDRATDMFMDTSAILKCLDLVITSDTSLAHLAGALNVPVWVALPFVPDWRWGETGSTTPWYPSMRLFRQPSKGDWTSVFAQINAALDA